MRVALLGAVAAVRFLLPPATSADGLAPLDALLTAVSVASSNAIGPMRPIIAGFIALFLLALGMQRLDRSESCTRVSETPLMTPA